MTVGKVVGSVVCTPKHDALSGVKLMLVRRYVAGKPAELLVAADSVQTAGPGNFVYMVDSTEAAASFRRGKIPVDLAIVGIIDQYNSKRCTIEEIN